jgi:hypothetical protein
MAIALLLGASRQAHAAPYVSPQCQLESQTMYDLSVQLATIKRMKPSPRSTAAVSNWMS